MLDPICSVADAAAFGYTVTGEDLARASARIRGYARQQVTSGTSTVLLTGPGPWLLPERPVTAVTSLVDGDGAPVAYVLRGQWLTASGADLAVTYSHGYATVPDQLVELCGQIAKRLGMTPDDLAAGGQQMATGAESMSYGGWAANAVSELMPGEKSVLDRLFPRLPRTRRLL